MFRVELYVMWSNVYFFKNWCQKQVNKLSKKKKKKFNGVSRTKA